MDLPVELQVQIFKHMVDTHPWEDVWRARLVSTSFNHEITTLIIKSHRLEVEGFCFEHACGTPHEPSLKNRRWNYFPTPLKRQYLHEKVQIHSRSPCVWSSFVHDILDLPHERTCAEETESLINKLIDAWSCGELGVMRPYVYPSEYQAHMEWAMDKSRDGYVEWEPIQETLGLALATSAIHRDDCSELRTLISEGVNLAQESVRFGIRPLEEAAKVGSNEVTEILVAHNYPLIYDDITEEHPFNALYMHMMRGNREGLKIWVDHLKRSGQNISQYFNPVNTVGFADIDMVMWIDDEYGDELDRSSLRGELFRYVVTCKDVKNMKRVLDRGGIDIDELEGEHGIAPLYAVLDIQWSPKGKKLIRERKRSFRGAEFLLNNGADPDGCGPKTPFSNAIKTGNVEAAIMLVECGATVDFWVIPYLRQDTEVDWSDLLEHLSHT